LFTFSLIMEGTTEKVLQFKMPVKSINNKNFGFVEQKMLFWTLQRFKQLKIYVLTLFLSWKYFSDDLLRGYPLLAYVSIKQICAFPLIKKKMECRLIDI